jgi:4-hydroxybenzoate polyprenyltransferase
MNPSVRHRAALYARLVRLDKPVGILLLLWPTLTALWIASAGMPALALVLVFSAGTVLMRSAGCAVNDAADSDFDRHVKRTAQRVVAAGQVSRREALGVGMALALASALLLLPLNPLSRLLAVCALAVAFSYPLLKRFFPLPQGYLAIAFSFGIPMAFAAVQDRVPALAWWLMAANLFWVVAYDTEYAMVDRDDDLRIGVRSSAILFGRADVAAVMACYGLHFSLLLLAGRLADLSWPFYLGCTAGVACAAYHYLLIRARRREDCFRAFLHNQWIGLAVFAGTVGSYALVPT